MQPMKNIMKNYEFVSSNGIPCSLGFGAYGSVQLGRDLKTGETVAIKKINRKMAVNQVQVHMKLNHPNIIKMYDYAFDERTSTTYIVLEYAQNGTLFDYVRQHGLKDKYMMRGIYNSVCDAIDYMHSMKIMHRDIKPENILLDRKNTVKVCDFGFAVNCEPRLTLCGTVEYMAPQMILRKPYTHKIDIWGLGILLFELIQGRAPFQGLNQDQVLNKMKKPIFFSKNFTKEEIDLIHHILKVNPDERPEIRQILKSPCLRLKQQKIPEEISKRSTTDDDKEEKQRTKNNGPNSRQIKIIQVKDLTPLQKKLGGKQIQITSIRDISQLDASISQINPHSYQKGDKISLRKPNRKS